MASEKRSDKEYNSFDDDDDLTGGSGEVTDDASETDQIKIEDTNEIKEEMYREKSKQIKIQLQQLDGGTLPEFCRKQKKLEIHHKDTQRRLQLNYNFYLARFDREQISKEEEIKAEWKKEKEDLKQSLIAGIIEKRKQLEIERQNSDLNSAINSNTKVQTRKLRPRPNEPMPTANEKRRREGVSAITYMASPEEIEDDLKAIESAKTMTSRDRHMNQQNGINECRVENGKLYFERTWFHLGQNILVVNHKDTTKYTAILHSTSDREIYVRKINDSAKIRIPLLHINKGRYSIKKKSI